MALLKAGDLMLTYNDSNLDENLSHHTVIDGNQYYLYGDRAYPMRPWLITSVRGPYLDKHEQHFNRSMNIVRTSVEWSFGEVKQ